MINLFMRKTEVSMFLPAVFAFICVCACSTSCISSKNLTYFNNLPDSVSIKLAAIQAPSALIQTNDIIDISIGGENEKTVEYINNYFTGGKSIQAIVDLEGNIELPKIGKLHVAGLSREAANDSISNAYKEYLVNPIVQVRFGDFSYTIMGEVKSPGQFTIPREKVSIFEAIGRAGDLTDYARRDDIKIIREVNGKREVVSVNLNDKEILNSPDYYIHRYDVIYVEAKEIKATTSNIQRVAPYLGLITSIIAFIVAIKK